MSILEGRTVLITGGTGSFGIAFTKEILLHHNPKVVRIFSRGELLQNQMQEAFKDSRLRFFIGDVRDRDRLFRAIEGADIVVHAAALKRIETCEYNPFEAVKTNITGSMNVADAALDCGVGKIMGISSDKSCHAVNMYGITKACMEKLFIQANAYAGKRKTRFSCVRYGNVIGSRGSVIPLFMEQREKGIITITDKRMTRFWISLEQGVNFVISCLEKMQGGEIFVPKIPTVRIVDLAEACAPGIKQVVTGIRPGEKLHEILLSEEEAERAKEFDDYFIIEPELEYLPILKIEGGRALLPGSGYSSDTNHLRLSRESLEEMVRHLEEK